MTDPKKSIIKRECKHAIYIEDQMGPSDDALYIKELIHYSDGTFGERFFPVVNYQRPFWIEREGNRKYKDKKEWQLKNRLKEYKSNQRNLVERISVALGKGKQKTSLRRICRSPYVYGADITPGALVKNQYQQKWPDTFTPNRVAVLDIETDVLYGTEYPIIGALTYRDKALLVMTKEYASRMADPIRLVEKRFQELLPNVVEKRKTKLQIEIVSDDGALAATLLKYAHQWSPDIISGWNIEYDITKLIVALERNGYNPADVFSDPSVESRFKYFKYQLGSKQKVTASGKVTPIPPVEQWHSVIAPSRFVWIDAMNLYYRNRVAKGKEPTYKLDYILNKELGMRKLQFETDDGEEPGSLPWHAAMQRDYPAEYCVYNLWDCIGVEELDEKTNDLSQTLSILSGVSEYTKFPSQPRRIADDLHFFMLERDHVVATTSDEMVDELDSLTVKLEEWIVTLPAYLAPEGDVKIVEDPSQETSIYTAVADIDSVSSYPSCTDAANLSKETTKKEIVSIGELSFHELQSVSINITGGHVNASSIARTVYNAPSFDTLLDDFAKEMCRS